MHKSIGGAGARAQDLRPIRHLGTDEAGAREKRMAVEDPVGPLGTYSTTLRPGPVPVAVRVVMVGRRSLRCAASEILTLALLFRHQGRGRSGRPSYAGDAACSTQC